MQVRSYSTSGVRRRHWHNNPFFPPPKARERRGEWIFFLNRHCTYVQSSSCNTQVAQPPAAAPHSLLSIQANRLSDQFNQPALPSLLSPTQVWLIMPCTHGRRRGYWGNSPYCPPQRFHQPGGGAPVAAVAVAPPPFLRMMS